MTTTTATPKTTKSKGKMQQTPMKKQKTPVKFLSKIASNIGPSFPIILLHQLKRSSVQHCNLHANDLTTLDIDAGRCLDTDDNGVSKYDDDGGGAILLEDLIELDISSNHLGHGCRTKNSSYTNNSPCNSDDENDNNEYEQDSTYKNEEHDTIHHDDPDHPHRGGRRRRKRKISLLSLCPNLQILNISANDLTTDSLSSIFLVPSSAELTSTLSPPSSPPPPPPPVSSPPPPPPTPTPTSASIQLNKLVELNLSHNGISSFPKDMHKVFPSLQSLNVKDNFLTSTKTFLQCLYPLKDSLKILIVQGGTTKCEEKKDSDDGTNPMCREDKWRQRTICILSNLRTLDEVNITIEDREEARFALEIGWMGMNNIINCDGTELGNSDGGADAMVDKNNIVVDKDKERKKSAMIKSIATSGRQQQKQRKGQASGRVSRNMSAATTRMEETQKRISNTSHRKKEQQLLPRNHVQEKSKPSLLHNKKLCERAIDVVTGKFDKALSHIQRTERSYEGQICNSPQSYSQTEQDGDKVGGCTQCCNRSGRKRSQQTEEQERITSQNENTCTDSTSIAAKSQLTSLTQNKLNKLENRVKLLSELAGEQAEVTGRLLLLSENSTESVQKHKGKSKRQVASMAPNVPIQTHLAMIGDIGTCVSNDDFHTNRKSTLKDIMVQTSSEIDLTNNMIQRGMNIHTNKDQLLQRRTQSIGWIMLVMIGQQQCCVALRTSFRLWKFHTAALHYSEQLENEISASKQRVHCAIRNTKQQTIVELNKVQQNRLKEVQNALGTARQINARLEQVVKTLNTKLCRAEEHNLKIERKYEQDMMLLGEASEQRAQELAMTVRRKEEQRFHIERNNIKEEMKKMEKDYSDLVSSIKKEMDIVSNEANEARKALNAERERRKVIEADYEELARKQEERLQTAKDEVSNIHEKEQRKLEKEMRAKMAQFKQAFEMTAKRAASDRAKCEQALCGRQEDLKTIKKQREMTHEMEKTILTSNQKMRKMEKAVHNILSMNSEMKHQLRNMTKKQTKCNVAIGMKDVQIESLKKEVEFAQDGMKGKDEKLNYLKNTLDKTKQERDNAVKDCSTQLRKIAALEQEGIKLQEALDEAEQATIKEKINTNSEKTYQLEEENKKLNEEITYIKRAADVKNEAQQQQVNHLEKELDILKQTLGSREDSIKCLKNEALLAEAAYETKERQQLLGHEKVKEKMYLTYQRDVCIFKEKLSGLEKEKSEAAKRCVDLESDAKALAQELLAERNIRIQTEAQVKSLSEALDSQGKMMQNAIEGICKRSSESILRQDKL